MKYDGKCLHGCGPGSPGDCTLDRKEGSCLCQEHHAAVERGEERAPPLRMTFDHYTPARKVLLMEDLSSPKPSTGNPKSDQALDELEELAKKLPRCPRCGWYGGHNVGCPQEIPS